MVSISTLIVAIRTAGTAALGAAALQFRRLARAASSAATSMGTMAASLARSLVPALGQAAAAAGVFGLKLAAVLAVALPLTAAVINLLPALMLLVPAMASLILLGTGLMMAFDGIGGALSAGLSGDAEAYAKALAKLPPPARDAVRAMVELRDAFKPIQVKVQAELFAGMGGELRTLTKLIAPIADTWLPRLGKRFAEVRHAIFSGLARFAADGRLERVWRMIHAAVSSLLGVLPHLARAFGDILEVAAPRFANLASGIEGVAKRFSDWIRAARDSGKLGEWLDKSIETWGTFKSIIGNVGEMLGAIFKGANDEGQSLLEKIDELTQRMADWLNSTDGQALIDTLASIVGWLIACKPAFEIVGAIGGRIFAELAGLWTGLKAIVSFVLNWILSGYEMLLTGAAKAFSWIPGLGPKLQAAADQFNKWKQQVNEAINGIQDTVTVTVVYRAVRIGPHMVSGAQLSGQYSSGIGGRAAGGPVQRGVPYIVGEKRPELFIPDQDGTIIPKLPPPSAGTPWAGGMANTAGLTVSGGDTGVASLIRYLIRTGALRLSVRNNRVVLE